MCLNSIRLGLSHEVKPSDRQHEEWNSPPSHPGKPNTSLLKKPASAADSESQVFKAFSPGQMPMSTAHTSTWRLGSPRFWTGCTPLWPAPYPLQGSKPPSKQINSNGYSNKYGLHRLVNGPSSRARTALMDLPNPTCAQHLSQVLADWGINRHGQTTLEHEPPMDEFIRNHYRGGFHGKTKKLPRRSATPCPNWGVINEGNSERRWEEQVQRVARKLAIVLWQSRGRGQSCCLWLPPWNQFLQRARKPKVSG